MGLSVMYCSSATLVRAGDFDPEPPREAALDHLEVNEAFDSHDTLVSGWYRVDDPQFFYAGAYSGYNRFRRELCQVAHGIEPEAVWAEPEGYDAFIELINFSDCEGIIGPESCARLASDFALFGSRVDAVHWSGPLFRDLYWRFAQAFKVAAGGGLVSF